MGSLCTSGPTTTNTTSNSSTTPNAVNQLNDIWSKVSSAASTPYQAYTGQLVAGLNPTQQTGISNVSNAVGTASPYFDLASQYGQAGAASINPNDVSKYMNPYTQSVINSTQANFNEGNQQQQQQLKGNAAAQGALGGDRVGVAQAELARQQNLSQAPVIAGLQQQNYTQALGAAQQDRAAQAQGAYTFGSLAPAVQNTAIQGGTAQIGAGTVAQQNQQQGLSAQYQQYLNQLAYPYQQASFLAQYGLPTAAAMGTTTSGTTQQKQYAAQPSLLQSIMGGAGVGLAAYDAFGGSGGSDAYGGGSAAGGDAYGGSAQAPLPGLSASDYGPMARGGRVGMSRGGRTTGRRSQRPRFADGGFVDQVNTIRHALRGGGPVMDMSRGPSGVYGYAGGGQVDENYVDGTLPWANIFSNVQPLAPPHVAAPQASPPPSAPSQSPSGGSGGGIGDLAKTAMKFLPMLLARGGRIGYADGGDVAEMPFDDRFPYAGEINSGGDAMADPRGVRAALQAFGAQSPNAPPPAPGPVAANVPMPPQRPPMAGPVAGGSPYSLPPQITNPGGAGGEPDMPPSALGYDGAAPPAGGLRAPPDASPAMLSPPMGRDSQAGSPRGALGLSEDARAALLAASFGILGSKASNALGALGEGGQQGVKVYTEAKNSRIRNEMEARKLIQQAEQFSQTLGVHKDQAAETKRYHDILDQNRQDALAERRTRAGYIRNPDGTMTPVKGGPADPEQISAVAKAKQTGALLPDDTADFLAERIVAGDAKALVGLGRGAQGAENIIRVQTMAARKAVERGMNPSDILAKVAEQSGLTASQRTFGTQTAKMAINSTEAQGALELGREASKAVPRTNWVPINKLIQAGQVITSDPKLIQFAAANLAIVNTYARAISPTGTPTVHDKEHAERLLSTATGPEAYNALLDQLNKEIEIAHAAPLKAKKELEAIRTAPKNEAGVVVPPPVAAPVIAKPETVPARTTTPAKPATVVQGGHTYVLQPDGSYK